MHMATASLPDDVSTPDQPESKPPRLDAWVESRPDGPDQYTVAPPDATGIDLMSCWLTVSADIVCDLTEMY